MSGKIQDLFKHKCSLPPVEDFTSKYIPGNSRTAKIKRASLRATTISDHHINAKRIFKSTTAINFERMRHLKSHKYIIHPFSRFRYAWNTFMIFVYLYALFIIPFYAAFLATSPQKSPTWAVYDLFHCVPCLVDIVLNCRTGYVDETDDIITVPWKIFSHYLLTYFIFDIVTSVPVDHVISLFDNNCTYCEIFACLRFLKYVRLRTIYKYINTTAETLDVQMIVVEALLLILIALYTVHCLCSIQYLASWMIVSWDSQTWILVEDIMPSRDLFTKYGNSLYRASAAFLVLGYGFTSPYSITDEVIIIFIAVMGTVLYIIAIGKVLQWTRIINSSTAKYDQMVQQLNTYMRAKQLPLALQRRLMDYYELRYQKTFINEAEILNALSSQLRQEIVLHSCRRLLENVSFFNNLPNAMLLRIVVCLHPQFFLANDVIVKAGAQGDAMFFIASGTVAIYTPTGKEVCHLEDGAHFGEIALVIESQRRVASVVAVESCELYRLDRNEFKRAISPYPDLLSRIQRIAEERFERIVQIDEKNRRRAR